MLVATLVWILLSASALVKSPTSLDAIRAAFVHNLVRFATWHPSAVEPSGLTFCVLGADGVASALEPLLQATPPNGRKLWLKRLTPADDVKACRVLYVDDATWRKDRDRVASVRDLPVLTIGESETFVRLGGIASLFAEGDNLRIAVNAAAARHSGVQLSSSLLRLAKAVKGEQVDPNE